MAERSRSLNRTKSVHERRGARSDRASGCSTRIRRRLQERAAAAEEERRSASSERPRSAMLLPLVKSESFGKFREAFKAGDVSKLHDDDEVEINMGAPQYVGVKAELEALRHCPRLQNLLRINRPQENPPKRYPGSSRRHAQGEQMELDEETMAEVSKSRAAIRDMFESTTAPKITFGGGAAVGGGGRPLKKAGSDILADKKLGARPKVARKVDPQFTERKWVFDTINKYFDVIKEDEEEEEREGEGDKEETSRYSSRSSLGAKSTLSTQRRSLLLGDFEQQQKLKLQNWEEGEAGGAGEILSRSRSSGKLREMVSSIVRR